MLHAYELMGSVDVDPLGQVEQLHQSLLLRNQGVTLYLQNQRDPSLPKESSFECH